VDALEARCTEAERQAGVLRAALDKTAQWLNHTQHVFVPGTSPESFRRCTVQPCASNRAAVEVGIQEMHEYAAALPIDHEAVTEGDKVVAAYLATEVPSAGADGAAR
jgi:hypothetical protein